MERGLFQPLLIVVSEELLADLLVVLVLEMFSASSARWIY